MINKKTLHIACWNINGYKVKGYSKYSDPRFINHIRNKHIICLLETHCPFQVSLILPNLSAVHLSRPKKTKRETKFQVEYQYLLNQNSNQASNF